MFQFLAFIGVCFYTVNAIHECVFVFLGCDFLVMKPSLNLTSAFYFLSHISSCWTDEYMCQSVLWPVHVNTSSICKFVIGRTAAKLSLADQLCCSYMCFRRNRQQQHIQAKSDTYTHAKIHRLIIVCPHFVQKHNTSTVVIWVWAATQGVFILGIKMWACPGIWNLSSSVLWIVVRTVFVDDHVLSWSDLSSLSLQLIETYRFQSILISRPF